MPEDELKALAWVFAAGCMTKAMLDAWRTVWSTEPGTTAPDFPFGLVVLASEEGECGAGAFRWAQTGNNGVLPSQELPNTFAAQGFDAQDPVGDANWPSGPQGCRVRGGYGDNAYSMSPPGPFTGFFMGPIHPRPKMTIGRRLALGAAAIAYNKTDIGYTGPVLASCNVTSKGIEFFFNDELLRGDAVAVFDAVTPVTLEGVELSSQLSTSKLCRNLPNGTENPYCTSFGALSPLEVEYSFEMPNGTVVSSWIPMSIATKRGPFINTDCQINPKFPTRPPCKNYTRKDNALVVQAPAALPKPKAGAPQFDFTKVITGVRYAWALGCCPAGQSVCPPNSCPVRGYNSTLPAPGFYAKIVYDDERAVGKCKCVPPQVCG